MDLITMDVIVSGLVPLILGAIIGHLVTSEYYETIAARRRYRRRIPEVPPSPDPELDELRKIAGLELDQVRKIVGDK